MPGVKTRIMHCHMILILILIHAYVVVNQISFSKLLHYTLKALHLCSHPSTAHSSLDIKYGFYDYKLKKVMLYKCQRAQYQRIVKV